MGALEKANKMAKDKTAVLVDADAKSLEKSVVRRPNLTRKMIEEMLGDKWDDMQIYDCRSGRWNLSLPYLKSHMGRDLQYILEMDARFANRKLMLFAVKQVDAGQYPGLDKFARNVSYNLKGRAVVADIIVFNAKTGLYETNPGGAFGVCMFDEAGLAARYGVSEAVLLLVSSISARNAFLSRFSQYQK